MGERSPDRILRLEPGEHFNRFRITRIVAHDPEFIFMDRGNTVSEFNDDGTTRRLSDGKMKGQRIVTRGGRFRAADFMAPGIYRHPSIDFAWNFLCAPDV